MQEEMSKLQNKQKVILKIQQIKMEEIKDKLV